MFGDAWHCYTLPHHCSTHVYRQGQNHRKLEGPGDAAAVSAVVETQVAIIKLESIASAVIEKLGLAQDPEFATGQSSGMISRLLGWARPETKASAVRYAVESFERKLSAKRIGPTYLVEITFDSKDPDRAAQILNAVVESNYSPVSAYS